MLIYKELEPITKEEFDDIVGRGNEIEIQIAAIRASEFIDDYRWLVDRYSVPLKSAHEGILYGALLGIGTVARLFRHADEKELKRLVRPLLKNPEVSRTAEDALSDIYVFLSRERRKRKRERRKALLKQNTADVSNG